MKIAKSSYDNKYWVEYCDDKHIYFDLIEILIKPNKIDINDLAIKEVIIDALESGEILTSINVDLDLVNADLCKYPVLKKYVYINGFDVAINCKIGTELLFDNEDLAFIESPFENMFWAKYGAGYELVKFTPNLDRISIMDLKSKDLIHDLLQADNDEIVVEEQYLDDLKMDITNYPELDLFVINGKEQTILKGEFVTKIMF